MSLQSRLGTLITAIGTDIKALQARTPTILAAIGSLSDTSQPSNAVEWWNSGVLVSKFISGSPIENATIPDRTDLRIRMKSRTGGVVLDKLILNSDGNTMLHPPLVTSLPTTGPGTNAALVDGQECYYVADTGGTSGGPVVWHLKYRTANAKWHYIGGAPLNYSKPFTAGPDTISASVYSNLPTTGSAASIVVPLTGDYDVYIDGQGDAPAADLSTFMGVKIGATTIANDNNAIRWRCNQLQQNAKTVRITGVAAGTTLLIQACASTTGGRIFEIDFRVTPVRVS